MNISQAKLIDLLFFLENEGYRPSKVRGNIYWFHSPIHMDKTPSFKVDCSRNEWYDFGLSFGGDIIDLVKEIYHVSNTSEALAILDPKTKPLLNCMYHSKEAPPRRQDSDQMRNIEFRALNHQALLSYMMKRKIDYRLSRVYCCEVHYELRNKHFFGIAFQNRSGGYEIRNPYFKGCIGHKDITIVRQKKDTVQEHVLLFEGFMDFLSYQVFLDDGNTQICLPFPCDYIIMNSINCLNKTLQELSSYQFVHSFLDNDDGGRRTYLSIREVFGEKAIDETHRFSPHNDLNDYLIKQEITTK